MILSLIAMIINYNDLYQVLKFECRKLYTVLSNLPHCWVCLIFSVYTADEHNTHVQKDIPPSYVAHPESKSNLENNLKNKIQRIK